MNGKSLKAGLPAAFLIAFVAGQALAQEGECPKVDAEVNVKALGIAYYPPAKTVGNFVPAVTVGKVMYLAGNGPKMPDGKFVIGKLGSGPGQLSVEQGYQASKFAAISLLSAMKAELGDLNKVKRIVKVLGMVNSDPTFTAQPRVINGASDLLVQVFGDCGKHARSAVGVSSLIFDIAVEIEMIVELRQENTVSCNDGQALVDGGDDYDYLLADESTDATGVHFKVLGFEYVGGRFGDDVIDARVATTALRSIPTAGMTLFYGGNGIDVFYGDEGFDTFVVSGKRADCSIAAYAGGNWWTVTALRDPPPNSAVNHRRTFRAKVETH